MIFKCEEDFGKKRVLHSGQLFHTPTFKMTVPLFTEKFYKVKDRFSFSTKFDFWSFISSKNEIKEDHSRRSKVDSFNLHRKIGHQFADLLNFDTMITWHASWSKWYVKARQDVKFCNQGKVQLGETNITEIHLSNHIPTLPSWPRH